MRRLAILALLTLSACGAPSGETNGAAPDLETAAIVRGLVPDPDGGDPVGLYARETDRVCIVEGRGGYRIGATTDFGDGVACSGSGSATLAGDRLNITLGDECRFEAALPGDRIVFPPKLPTGCATLCRGRASFAAIDASRLSDSGSEARAMRGANGKLLCATD